MLKREKRLYSIVSAVLLVLMLFALLPFVLVLINSFKTLLEIAQNILGMPSSFSMANYVRAWNALTFPRSFMNTLFVTLVGDLGLIVFGTMTGYWLIRHKNKFNNGFYFLLMASMSIPFEAVMIPVVKLTNICHLNGSLIGLGVCYWGLSASTVVFLTYGAVMNIPYELEEAARIDGCSTLRLFWQVVFPLLKPTVLTFTIINTFHFWGDYLMPQLMLGRDATLYTLQLSMRSLFTEHFAMWDVALAALVLTLIPTTIFFLIAQKNIIAGITAGAVKG